MRGDRPSFREMNVPTIQATPHARGSTRSKIRKRRIDRGYPACAGIDRTKDSQA